MAKKYHFVAPAHVLTPRTTPGRTSLAASGRTDRVTPAMAAIEAALALEDVSPSGDPVARAQAAIEAALALTDDDILSPSGSRGRLPAPIRPRADPAVVAGIAGAVVVACVLAVPLLLLIWVYWYWWYRFFEAADRAGMMPW